MYFNSCLGGSNQSFRAASQPNLGQTMASFPMALLAYYSHGCNLIQSKHTKGVPTMKFWNLVSDNTQSKCYNILSLTEFAWEFQQCIVGYCLVLPVWSRQRCFCLILWYHHLFCCSLLASVLWVNDEWIRGHTAYTPPLVSDPQLLHL